MVGVKVTKPDGRCRVLKAGLTSFRETDKMGRAPLSHPELEYLILLLCRARKMNQA